MKLSRMHGHKARNGIAAAIAVACTALAGVAAADPINFIPGNTDISIKFTDREIEITSLGQKLFGIINITQILNAAGTTTFWNGNGGSDGTQLVGVFQNLTAIADQTGGGGLSFTGGDLELYLVPNGSYNPGCAPNSITGTDLNKNLAGGAGCAVNALPTPWLTADFVPGINNVIPGGNATLQAAFALTNVQAGFGYLSVAGGGTNNAYFDTNGYTFAQNVFGPGVNAFAPADLFLRSNFVLANPQTCTAPDGWQVCSDDPVQGKTVPEPATIALLGLGALAAGVVRRKKAA